MEVKLAQKVILAIYLFAFFGLIIKPAMALDRFVDNGDVTVTDIKTGLMWTTKDNGNPKEKTNETNEKYDGKHDAFDDERHIRRGKRGFDDQNDADDDGRCQFG